MKTFNYKYSLLLVVALIVSLFGYADKKEEIYEKNISKKYDVNSDAMFNVSNKYGKVHITTWNENKIEIDIKVSLSADSPERGQKQLDQIKFEFSNSKDEVVAKTLFNAKGSYNHLDIDYTVKMPANGKLKLNNKFGDAYINEINGTTHVKVSYGDFQAGKLNNKENNITIKYGKLRVEEGKYLDCVLRYSESNLKKVQWLKLDSQYSESKIGATGLFDLQSAYDDIYIQAAAKINSDAKFTDIKVGKLTQKLELSGAYGDIEVEYISSDFQEILLKSAYADVDLTFETGSNFTFDGKVSYADLDIPNKSALRKGSGNLSKSYQGIVGNGTPKATVTINSSYGDVDIDFKN